MLASQLCVFDDRTDLKWKWVEKTHSMDVLFQLSCLFVKISICDALPSRILFNDVMHAKWMCHALTRGIRTIKTFLKYKKLLTINLSQKNARKQCPMLSSMWQNKNYEIKGTQHQLQIFAENFKFLLHSIHICLLTSHWC